MQQLIAPPYIILILVFLEICISIVFTSQNFDGIEVGVPFTLTWENATGAVMLALLYKNTSSSQLQTYLIATEITESQFAWTPPAWTSEVFQQQIAAQDDRNLIMTGNLTISKATASAASTTPLPTDSVNVTAASNLTSSKEHTTSQPQFNAAAKVRIGFGVGIVVVLIIIGVALIFFEHGKRIGARSEQPSQSNSSLGRAEQGTMGLEMIERKLSVKNEIDKDITNDIKDEPSTPLLYKNLSGLKLVVELDGGVQDKLNNEQVGEASESEERKKSILTMRSIYELG